MSQQGPRQLSSPPLAGAPSRDSGPPPREARRRLAVAAVVAVAALIVAWSGLAVRKAILWSRADHLARASRWDAAEDALARLAWYGRLGPEALRLRAESAVRRGDPALAARCLGAVPDHAPGAVSARMRQARLLLELFRMREAEAAYRAVLRLDPSLSEARRALIMVLGLKGRAREQEAELWALHDGANLTTAIEALCYLAPGSAVVPPDGLARNADEGAVLAPCVAQDPTDDEARAALSRFYRQRGRIDEAFALCESRHVDHNEGSMLADEVRALLLDTGQLAEAAAWFEPVPPATRDSARFWGLRGDWLRARGRDADAVASYEEAVRIVPRDPAWHYRLGQALRGAGRLEAADRHLGWFQHAEELKAIASRIDLDAPQPEALQRAAELCRLMDRDREARAWLGASERANRAGHTASATTSGAPLP